MADAAVDFLVQNLRQLLTRRRIGLIGGVEEDVKKLEQDLSNFMAFLSASPKKHRQDAKLQELLRLLRDVVYNAEDVVDAFVTQKVDKSRSTKNYFLGAFRGEVRSITEAVEAVNSSIRDIYDRFDHFGNLNVRDGDPDELVEAPLMRNDNVVGFLDEVEKLLRYLKEETDNLDVISIIGSPGIGKTTLAEMVFNHPEIRYEFPIRIWIYVSSEFTRRDVFLSILKQLRGNVPMDLYHNKNDLDQLAKLVSAELQRGKFLIVMDDVWLAEDWKELKIAFPEKGKVLITSRQEDVARFANHNRDPLFARFLSHEESVLGIGSEIFGKPDFPQEFKMLVDEFARYCEGRPLTIEVVGSILARKFSASAGSSSMENEWEKVLNALITIRNDDEWRRLDKIISLSYSNLPHHLRACFLYFGMFPEDYAIPKWDLIRMWIAEGFVQEKDNISLEETAEKYLKELINMNLVRIDRLKREGGVKTCKVLNMMHQFAKAEAITERENFLQVITNSSHGRGNQNYRHLCAHSNILDFISPNPYGPRVRSFVCCNAGEIKLTNKISVNSLFSAFKLIRVLDVKPIKFSELSNDLFKLLHLRYIHLSLRCNYLPSAFSKLWNIQTLIIDTTSSNLTIKADIWKMIHLRHFKTNATATLRKPGKNSEGGEKLQTLGTISTESCTKEVFGRARNLKKLGIRGKLALFLNGKIGSFESLGKLSNLEKLKLLNHVNFEGQIYDLPPHNNFPPKLRSLTLSATSLEWRHMSVLGLLENLNVLKLKDRAFMGNCWKVEDGGFPKLELLHIGRTDLEFWTASDHHFPSLRHLELNCCGMLREVPFGLADIPSFQILDLFLAKSAATSAMRIRDAKYKKAQDDAEQTAQARTAFKLSIFPLEDY